MKDDIVVDMQCALIKVGRLISTVKIFTWRKEIPRLTSQFRSMMSALTKAHELASIHQDQIKT